MTRYYISGDHAGAGDIAYIATARRALSLAKGLVADRGGGAGDDGKDRRQIKGTLTMTSDEPSADSRMISQRGGIISAERRLLDDLPLPLPPPPGRPPILSHLPPNPPAGVS